VINNGGVPVGFFSGGDCDGREANIAPNSSNPDLGFDAHSYNLSVAF
jgi:hypothetical protein